MSSTDAKHAETQCWVERLSGSEFQVDGPATAKHQRTKLFRWSRGTINFRWLADCRCWRPATSAVDV